MCAQYFPSNANVSLPDGNTVSVEVITEYPFDDTVTFNIDAKSAFPFSMRIPAWCRNASIVMHDNSVGGQLPAGLHTVNLPAGVSHLVLHLPMEIRIERRPPYRLTPTQSVDTLSANIYRGPLLYALSRDFSRDHSAPYDDDPSLLPAGQAHGENQYLLGTGRWTYALRVNDDRQP